MHTSLQEVLAVRDAGASPRFDIYAGIHKGLRLMLSDALARAGRVDPASPSQRRELAETVEQLADLCESHLSHENAFIHPAIERVQAAGSRRIAAEHVDHQQDIAALREHARQLRDVPADQRDAACRSLYQALALFMAHNMAHMHIEETEHNALLWAHYSDAEIIAIQGQLVAHLEPAEKMAALRWMLPGMAPTERRMLLAGLRADAPPQAFEAILALARQVLAPEDWLALAQGLETPVAV